MAINALIMVSDCAAKNERRKDTPKHTERVCGMRSSCPEDNDNFRTFVYLNHPALKILKVLLIFNR